LGIDIKAGKFHLSFFNPKPKKQSPFKVVGATGVQFYSGFITNEEYLADLDREKCIAVYDKMRRNDAQVRGTLYAIMLPIRQAKWYMEPASDKPVDVEIAERIQENLFRQMIITWDDFLRQALGYLTFGFSVFEKVYQLYDDNKVLLKKLAPRLQSSIYRWYNDDDDNFTGLQQFVQDGDGGPYKYIDIYKDKLVLFVNDQEGNNYRGISVLRSAYKHWYIKDKLYKIDAIGHDRFASGVPVMTESEVANDDDRDRVATILENLHSRERSYVTKPYGWELELFEKTGSNTAIINSIKHHNEEIAKNVMAQFINLGTTGSGSRALGESFEELFMQSLNAVADYVAGIVNRQVIRQMVDMNWTVEDYPRLKHNRIMLNVPKWLEGLNKIGLANAVTRDNDIEQVLRESLGLPLMSEETIKQRDEMRQNIVENTKSKKEMPDDEGDNKEEDETELEKAAIEHPKAKQLKERKRMRELTEIEELICDFDEVEKCLNDGVDKFTKQVLKIKAQQAEFLSKEVLKKTADKIRVPYVDKLADRLYKEQKRQMNKGRRHLREEIQRQNEIAKNRELKKPELLDDDDFEDKEKVDQFLRDKSKADAQSISNKTLGAAIFAMYNLDPEVTSAADKEVAIFASVMDTGNRDIAGIAEASTNKAYALGRETQATTYSDQIEYAIYSAVLDGGTCETCSPKDGVAHELDDSRFSTPNPTCRGGDRCRCINIYKTKELDVEIQLRTPADWEKEDKAIQEGKLKNKAVVEKRREEK
jgi:hypothetical protein